MRRCQLGLIDLVGIPTVALWVAAVSSLAACSPRIAACVGPHARLEACPAPVVSCSNHCTEKGYDLPDLKVAGNQLVIGERVAVLHGVNRSGSEYECFQPGDRAWAFDGPVDQPAIDALRSWKINFVRVPLNEECWLGINGAGVDANGVGFTALRYQRLIVRFVEDLNRNGIYVILSLQAVAPGTLLSSGPEGVPMADADHAVDFWKSVAATFHANHAVVFDLFNEPHLDHADRADLQGVDPWACWRDGCVVNALKQPGGLTYRAVGMQDLVTAIRSAGASQPLMIGGLDYANDLAKWRQYQPIDLYQQSIASVHIYGGNRCRDANCWNEQLAPLHAFVPVVIGEFGEDDCTHRFVDTVMAWADRAQISYLAWAWDCGGTWTCEGGPTLISAYDGTPTNYGVGVRDHLRALPP
jgi:Cellulase (glycosyl hydrolase family 5)